LATAARSSDNKWWSVIADSHTDSNCYIDSDPNAECNAHRNTKAYSDAEVSSHGSVASHAAAVKETVITGSRLHPVSLVLSTLRPKSSVWGHQTLGTCSCPFARRDFARLKAEERVGAPRW
jgi:hypothetical protein